MTQWNLADAGSLGHYPEDKAGSIGALPRQSFTFDLDDDLVKVVELWSEGPWLHVDVRYGRDVLVHEETHLFEVCSPVSVEQTAFGVIVRESRRGFPWLRRRIRKF